MIGFDADPDKGNICVTKCRSCRKTLNFEATEEEECCGHRYVGEDLYRAEAADGSHDEYEDFESPDQPKNRSIYALVQSGRNQCL